MRRVNVIRCRRNIPPAPVRVEKAGPHHITQRGNNRQDVFFTDQDRSFYLDTLKERGEEYGLRVIGYCLMTNHIHLIAVPDSESSLAKAVGGTHLRYARYVNRLHGRSGHLWQNRFFSCPLEERHYLAALRYVERNPVRARMVRLPWRYPWSSATAHCEGKDPTGLLHMKTWRGWTRPGRWREFLRSPDDQDFADSIRTRTFNGRPLGSDRFIAKLETKLNRRLRPRPRGRPKKKVSKTGKPRRTRRNP